MQVGSRVPSAGTTPLETSFPPGRRLPQWGAPLVTGWVGLRLSGRGQVSANSGESLPPHSGWAAVAVELGALRRGICQRQVGWDKQVA